MKFNEINEKIVGGIEFVALITKLEKRPTKSGSDYLTLELTTKEGILPAKKWKINNDDNQLKVGDVIEGTATVDNYGGTISLVIQEMKKLAIDPAEFTLTAIEPVDEVIKEFKTYVDSIQKEELIKVVTELLDNEVLEKFYNHPAAKSNHHAEVHGLLYHTTRMMRAADALCLCYNKNQNLVNRDLVIVGILFHDIGKLMELDVLPTGAGEYTKYSLIGHITLGAMKIEEYRLKGLLSEEIAFQLEHIVLSHHGKLEYGSPVVPATIEAKIVSAVDGLDASVFAIQTEQLRMRPGELSKNNVFSIGSKVYYPPIEE